jgi:enediyne biosynthesis protein E4
VRARCLVLCLAAAACDGVETVETATPVPVQRADVPAAAGDRFADVTVRAGLDFVHRIADGKLDNIIETVGSGATWFDHDGDGHLDVYLIQSAWNPRVSRGERPEGPAPVNRLFRNRGDGTFEDVTVRAGVGDPGFGFMALAADYDDDGHTDLFVLNSGPNVLYRNRGDGTFEDVTDSAGVAGNRCSVGGVFFDANGDGALDLYVGNYLEFDPDYTAHYAPDVFPGPLAYSAEPDQLYLNAGDGTFRDATGGSGIDGEPGRAMGVAPLDFDGDGDTDVFVANDATDNFLFRNDGSGHFTEVALRAGLAFGVNGEATAAMAGAVGDFDGDGLPDLHVTDARYGSLYRNQGKGIFRDVVFRSGIASMSGQWASWGGGFLDFDADGDLDLFVVNGDMHRATGRPDLLLANTGDGRFEDASESAGVCFRVEAAGRGGTVADFDSDGDPDLLVTVVGGPPILLENRVPSGERRVTIRLQGAAGARAAHGARIEVEAAGRTWTRTVQAPVGYLSQGDSRMSFGLGGATVVDRISVVWPRGKRHDFRDLAVGRIHTIHEETGLQ